MPFNGRALDNKFLNLISDLAATVMSPLADVTAALFNGAVFHDHPDRRSNVVAFTSGPTSLDGGRAWTWISFHQPGQAIMLANLDLYLMFRYGFKHKAYDASVQPRSLG